MKKIVSLFLLLFVVVGCSNGITSSNSSSTCTCISDTSQGVAYHPEKINFMNSNLREYGYDFNIYLNSITIKNGVITISSTIENNFSTPIETDDITFRIYNEFETLKKEIIQPNEKKEFTVNIKFPLKNHPAPLSIKYIDPAKYDDKELTRTLMVP